MSEQGRTIFSFVIDNDPSFIYEGWHLARSLVEHCGGDPGLIHVQCTPEVNEETRDLFRQLGCCIHTLSRFGDGRWCNKLNQLENLRDFDFSRVALLDTDTIAVSDLRPFLSDSAILGKIVDLARPPTATLNEIASAAGISNMPPRCFTDASGEETYLGNCNGGFYSVPKTLCDRLSTEWRHAALWLLDNVEPLKRIGRENHVDQVSFWLAIQRAQLPFEPAPSNVNYFLHLKAAHRYFDAGRPISLLHYHHVSLNVVGLLEPPVEVSPVASAAVAKANTQISRGFDNRVFWELRYRHFPERGSGIGSRGENISYKRRLLKKQKVEKASSVLDFGCGDLEVVKALRIKRYLGVDQSEESIKIARRARPDWQFRLTPVTDLPAAEMVLCFEVLIHQKTRADYDKIIDVLAAKSLRTLLVSGFDAENEGIRLNPMLFFYEPLVDSLRRTNRFSRIRQIGAHTGVTIYRCEV